MPNAALYLRSSKDRSDVSIDAQRRELQKLAEAKGLTVVDEFADAVESGKTEMRPGFQALLRELRAPGRTWQHLLLLDTSRLSRRQYMAYVFDHECKRRGITVFYSKVPDTDPITDMVIKGVLRVFDEFHSLMSREKGLAGMAENVRRGFRAGGRAPRGYLLESVTTDAIRNGEPVMKSRLVPGPDADIVSGYLKARAGGLPRTRAQQKFGLPTTGMVDLEWNALTYAGHTVWNMRNAHDQGYTGGKKRRPRSEWLVQRDTHAALITEAEAEQLLLGLEASVYGRRRTGTALLSNLLRTAAGAAWHCDGHRRYRVKRANGKDRSIDVENIEPLVLQQIGADLASPDFIGEIVAAANQRGARRNVDLKPLREQLQTLTRKISLAMDMAGEMTNRAPALRRIEEMEVQRAALADALMRQESNQAEADALQRVTAKQVTQALRTLAFMPGDDREAIRDSLLQLVEKIELDPETGDCRVHYRITPATRLMMASPSRGMVSPLAVCLEKAIPLEPFKRDRTPSRERSYRARGRRTSPSR